MNRHTINRLAHAPLVQYDNRPTTLIALIHEDRWQHRLIYTDPHNHLVVETHSPTTIKERLAEIKTRETRWATALTGDQAIGPYPVLYLHEDRAYIRAFRFRFLLPDSGKTTVVTTGYNEPDDQWYYAKRISDYAMRPPDQRRASYFAEAIAYGWKQPVQLITPHVVLT